MGYSQKKPHGAILRSSTRTAAPLDTTACKIIWWNPSGNTMNNQFHPWCVSWSCFSSRMRNTDWFTSAHNIKVASLALGQLHGCPGARKVTFSVVGWKPRTKPEWVNARGDDCRLPNLWRVLYNMGMDDTWFCKVYICTSWTHRGKVTHICITTALDNGLSHIQFIWSSAGLLLVESFGAYSSEIWFKIKRFPLKKINLNDSSVTCRPLVSASICWLSDTLMWQRLSWTTLIQVMVCYLEWIRILLHKTLPTSIRLQGRYFEIYSVLMAINWK